MSGNRQNFIGFHSSLCDLVALVHPVALGHPQRGAVDHLALKPLSIVRSDHHKVPAFGVLFKGDHAVQMGDDGAVLGFAGLEQLFHAGKALGDIRRRGDAAGVEGSHRQLGARLTDRLGGDDPHRLAHAHRLAVGQVGAIAFGADADLALTVEGGADLHLGDSSVLDPLGVRLGHHLVAVHQHLAGSGVQHIVGYIAAQQALGKILDDTAAVHDVTDHNTLMGAAVVLPNDDILGDVHQTAGQVPRVGGPQGGIRQALPGASRGVEVFQNVQALTVVGLDGDFDGAAGGVGDDATHTSQLTDLIHGATGARVGHHIDGVVDVQRLLQSVLYLGGAVVPGGNHPLVPHIVRNEAAVVLAFDLVHLLLGLGQQLGLLRRDHRVVNRHGEGALGGVFITLGLDPVQHFSSLRGAILVDRPVDDLPQLLFAHQKADLQVKHVVGVAPVHIAQILRDRIVEDDPAHSGLHNLGDPFIPHLFGDPHLDGGMQAHAARLIGHGGLVEISEHLACADLLLPNHCQVVGAQHHILGGHGNRLAVRRFEQVVGCQHQEPGLRLGLRGQGHMHRHLVAVKVGVVSGTDQRVQLQGAAFHQHRLKGLDTQAVQSRGAVEQDRVVLDDHF